MTGEPTEDADAVAQAETVMRDAEDEQLTKWCEATLAAMRKRGARNSNELFWTLLVADDADAATELEELQSFLRYATLINPADDEEDES